MKTSLAAEGFAARARAPVWSGDAAAWVLRGTSDRAWVYAGGDPDAVLRLLDGRDSHCAAIAPALADRLAKTRRVVWRRDARTFVLPADGALPEGPFATRALGPGDAAIIDEHWEHRDEVSLQYLRERLTTDPAFGVVHDGRLIGWELVHDDGALGAAFVLPAFRRKGVMRSLQHAMVSALRRRGLPAFKHVALDNHGWLEAQEPSGWRAVAEATWLELSP